MAVFSKGNFSINLGFCKIGGELTSEDRQCAWEFYAEITSRVAVFGKIDEQRKHAFAGEVIIESLDSIYQFFIESRAIMRRYPVGKIGMSEDDHLGFTIARILEVVIRPFLEKWQVVYRYWWDTESDTSLPPFQRQESFPRLDELRNDWTFIRVFCRECASELADLYNFLPINELIPIDVQRKWFDEQSKVADSLRKKQRTLKTHKQKNEL